MRRNRQTKPKRAINATSGPRVAATVSTQPEPVYLLRPEVETAGPRNVAASFGIRPVNTAGRHRAECRDLSSVPDSIVSLEVREWNRELSQRARMHPAPVTRRC